MLFTSRTSLESHDTVQDVQYSARLGLAAKLNFVNTFPRRILRQKFALFSTFEAMNSSGKGVKVRKDPWARFEAWRYHPAINKHANIRNLIPGFWFGVGAFVIAVGIEKLLEKPDDHGGHH